MSLPATALPSQNPNALLAILWGGLFCGVLDITAALMVYGYMGAKPVRLLQGIAGGLLGPGTYGGGIVTALLGLLCHFVIAFRPPQSLWPRAGWHPSWCDTPSLVARCTA